MSLTDDIRKTLTDPTPFYVAAGLFDKLREDAPDRIAAVRATDPKDVQTRVNEVLGTIDSDVKKLREQAQNLAMQGVGFAAEYAVKARETYDELAERGRDAVQSRRDDDAKDGADVTVERQPVRVAEPPADDDSSGRRGSTSSGRKSANGSRDAASGRRTSQSQSSQSRSANGSSKSGSGKSAGTQRSGGSGTSSASGTSGSQSSRSKSSGTGSKSSSSGGSGSSSSRSGSGSGSSSSSGSVSGSSGAGKSTGGSGTTAKSDS